jgi:lipoprotein-anchoring transpeptidase ErfK/SrfK
MLTRILWLSGLEVGKNRLGNVDTMRRYIYVHGAPDEAPMGVPGSRGCVRMQNQELIDYFDLIPVGSRVLILE